MKKVIRPSLGAQDSRPTGTRTTESITTTSTTLSSVSDKKIDFYTMRKIKNQNAKLRN